MAHTNSIKTRLVLSPVTIVHLYLNRRNRKFPPEINLAFVIFDLTVT